MGGTINQLLLRDKKNNNTKTSAQPKAAQLTSDPACTRPRHQGAAGNTFRMPAKVPQPVSIHHRCIDLRTKKTNKKKKTVLQTLSKMARAGYMISTATSAKLVVSTQLTANTDDLMASVQMRGSKGTRYRKARPPNR